MEGGIILLDKPKGMTSFECDKKVRKSTGIKKIGHSGTLDPFATGLLPIFVGDALKYMRYTDNFDKTYVCKALFGAVSDTGDSDGVIKHKRKKPREKDIDSIKDALAEIASRTTQTPPKFSAKKINGQKAYDLARKGIDFELKPVAIKIYSLTVLNTEVVKEGVIVDFEVHCSKGTYIRTICTDAGDLTGFGAYALELRRTKAGPFSIDDTCVPANIGDFIDPSITLHDMPSVDLDKARADDLKHGRRFHADKLEGFSCKPNELCQAKLNGVLIAVIYSDEDGIIRVDRGFA